MEATSRVEAGKEAGCACMEEAASVEDGLGSEEGHGESDIVEPRGKGGSACGEVDDARRCGGRREGGATARVPDVEGSGSARGEGGSGDGGGRRSGSVGEGEESCAVNGNRKYSTAKKGG